MGKLPNYLQYFGSDNVEGVAKNWEDAEMSWLEVEMSWMEVDGAGRSWAHGLVIPLKNSLITHQGLLYSKKQFCSGGNL